MNENICENCDNFMFTYIDDKKNLYNCCKKCGNKEIIDNTKSKNKYKIQKKLNISDILNTNSHILNDSTLPKLSNNVNIKCPNSNCDTNIKKIVCNISYILDIVLQNLIASEKC